MAAAVAASSPAGILSTARALTVTYSAKPPPSCQVTTRSPIRTSRRPGLSLLRCPRSPRPAHRGAGPDLIAAQCDQSINKAEGRRFNLEPDRISAVGTNIRHLCPTQTCCPCPRESNRFAQRLKGPDHTPQISEFARQARAPSMGCPRSRPSLIPQSPFAGTEVSEFLLS